MKYRLYSYESLSGNGTFYRLQKKVLWWWVHPKQDELNRFFASIETAETELNKYIASLTLNVVKEYEF